MDVLYKEDIYVLNHCTKYLNRFNEEPRHNFGQYPPGDERGKICEAWRFPVIDSYYSAAVGEKSYTFNEVTFIYDARKDAYIQDIQLIGTFSSYYEKISLQPVMFGGEKTGYWSVTLVLPKGKVYYYKFIVDGTIMNDPINPQFKTKDNGIIWSQFFTHLCTLPLTLDPMEMIILDRFVDHIMPFQTSSGKRFLEHYYNFLDDQGKMTQYLHAYRLDQSVGIVNFIDKLLTREERHHLLDYRICLNIADQVLRKRYPYSDVSMMPKELFIQLYIELGTGNIPGWDYSQYNNPSYFLQLLRRHVLTGAFAHPKYGGNVGGICWAYLGERFTDKDTKSTLFDWAQSIEAPLGRSTEYRG